MKKSLVSLLTIGYSGKKQIQGLEQRLSEAEKEIEREQHKHTDAQKIIRKQERRCDIYNKNKSLKI